MHSNGRRFPCYVVAMQGRTQSVSLILAPPVQSIGKLFISDGVHTRRPTVYIYIRHLLEHMDVFRNILSSKVQKNLGGCGQKIRLHTFQLTFLINTLITQYLLTLQRNCRCLGGGVIFETQ